MKVLGILTAVFILAFYLIGDSIKISLDSSANKATIKIDFILRKEENKK